MTNDELRPCPFCGNTDLKIMGVDNVAVVCMCCNARGPMVYKEHICETKYATEGWNRRVNE